jgi:hypothetical protein
MLLPVANLYNVDLPVGIPEGDKREGVTRMIDTSIRKLLDKINIYPKHVMNFYGEINEILTILKPFVIYEKFVIVDDGQENSNYSRSFLAYYLFYLFHESTFMKMITTFDSPFDSFLLINYYLLCKNIYMYPLSISSRNTHYIIDYCEKKIGGRPAENIMREMIVPVKADLSHIAKQIDNYIAYYNKIFNNKIINNKPNVTISSPIEDFEKYNSYVSFDFRMIDYEFKMGLLSNYYKKPLKEGGPFLNQSFVYLKDAFIFSEAYDVNMTQENQKLICDFISLIPKHINKIIRLILPSDFDILEVDFSSSLRV